MEPRIQYARTADGVSIAFWTLGEGPPLVYLAGGQWSHIELWQVPACRHWYERLAQQRTLVRYDVRSTGLSERDVTDYSLDALVRDVEAVVDRLGLDRFALLGAADAGPVAIAFAARRPEQVSHLVLWCAWARNADLRSPRIRAWLSLIHHDWELMTDTCAQLVLGWSAGEIGRRAAAHLRESVTREAAQLALKAHRTFNVTDLLPAVAAPTLVLHRHDISWLPIDIARGLASRLRDARLIILPGESTAPYLGDTDELVQAIDAFLGERAAAPAAAAAASGVEPEATLAEFAGRDLIGRDATVVSTDPTSGNGVRIEVRDGEARWDPTEAVVFVGNVGGEGPAAQTRCPLINVFWSADSANTSRRAHPEVQGRVLTPAEAVEACRRAFGAVGDGPGEDDTMACGDGCCRC